MRTSKNIRLTTRPQSIPPRSCSLILFFTSIFLNSFLELLFLNLCALYYKIQTKYISIDIILLGERVDLMSSYEWCRGC